MDQFINQEQINFYDMTRPKYTEEIFQNIISNVKNFDNYLDLACGSGQLLIPVSKYFKNSFGMDFSQEQINKANENLKKQEISNQVKLYQGDVYEILNKIETDISIDSEEKLNFKKFDLITIGQAFHWFEETRFLDFVKKILSENGVLILAGYKKQHFDEQTQPELYKYFNLVEEKLLPYFECDVDNNDNAYYKSYETIQKFFQVEKDQIKVRFFREEAEVPLKKVFDLLKSWSAYVNYLKIKKLEEIDLIEEYQNNLKLYLGTDILEDLEKTKVTYFNFYFTVTVFNC
jgi:ubiquinone/menaquinone biosynthesis C-methylase UbiE